MSHVLSGVSGPNFTKFLYNVQASSLLLTHALDDDIPSHCGTPVQRIEVVSISVRFLAAKINRLPQQRPGVTYCIF